MSAETASPARRPDRSRLLKNFYGLETPPVNSPDINNAPSMEPIAAPLETSSDPLDLNGKNFNAEKYMQKILHDKNLKTLLHTQVDFIDKVKELDSEMKTLVYNNYEKFISASDIIKKMKSNVESMEVEMNKLGDHISNITDQSTGISASFSEKRTRIRELGSRHALLRKLQFIFDLPNKLKSCMQKSQFTDAVKYHFRANLVLQRYQDLPVFGTLEADCTEIMREVGKRLKKNISGGKSGAAELCAYAGCLLALNQDPVDTWKTLIKVIPTRLKQISQDALVFKESPSTNGTAPSVIKMRNLNTTFLKEFCAFLTAFNDLFLAHSLQTPDDKSKVSLSADGRFFSVSLDDEQVKAAKSDLDECMRALLHDYFTTVEGFLELPDNKAIENVQFPSEVYISVLDMLYNDINREAQSSEVVKDTLLARATSLCEVFLNRIVHSLFTVTKSDLFSKLNGVNQLEIKSTTLENLQEPHELAVFIDSTNTWLLKQAVPKCVEELRKFTTSDSTFMKSYSVAFQEAVRSELQSFWSDIVDHMKEQSTSLQFKLARPIPASQINHPRTIMLLVMHKLCIVFENSTVAESYQVFVQANNLWPETDMGSPIAAKSGSLDSIDSVVPEISVVLERLSKVSKKLLYQFVEHAACEFSHMIRKSFETRNWLTMKEPRRPSKLWEQILEDFHCISVEVEQIMAQKNSNSNEHLESSQHQSASKSIVSSHYFGTNQSTTKTAFNGSNNMSRVSAMDSRMSNMLSGSATNLNSRAGVQNKFLSNIDKLFSEHVEIFGRIQPENRSGIMHSLTKIVLRALVEFVRAKVLNKNALQQMQVDVEFIRVNFWVFVQDEKTINQLMDEVVSSAVGRCLEPSATMEFSVIEKILASSATSAGQVNDS